MENIWPIILVGGITAVAGYVFGMIDSRVTNALKETREKVVASDEAAAAKLDEHDVLRVTIDPALKWHLALDGVRVEADGLTVEQRARLVNVVVQIRPWIDAKNIPSPFPTPPAPDLPTPRPPAAIQPPAASAPAIPPAAPIIPPRLNPLEGFRSLLKREIAAPKIQAAPSMLKMIDDFLQQKLVGSPLAAKEISLEEGPQGEVIVVVGRERYSGIDAVPDEEIRAIIRAAIAEWNK